MITQSMLLSSHAMETFGVWLNNELKRRNMLRAELARLAGVQKSTVTNLIKGKWEIGTDVAYKIGPVLGYSPEDLLRIAGKLDMPKEASDPIAYQNLMQLALELPADELQELADIAFGKKEKVLRRASSQKPK